MKVARLVAPWRMEVDEESDPRIQAASEVCVRIDRVGLCGSDLHYFRTGRIGEQVASTPFTPGHEGVGTVIEVGSGVTRIRPGDRVVLEPSLSCGVCDQCRIGRPHTCRRIRFMGAPDQFPGALRERLVVPETQCLPIPAEIPLEVAVFSEPMSIALYAWEFLRDRDIRTVAVLGAGPIGLAVLLVGKRERGVRAYVSEPLAHRREAASALGIERAVDPLTEDVIQKMPFEADAVFECCGRPEAFIQAIHLLKPGGHLVLVGIHEAETLGVDPHLLRRKEITWHNVRRQNGCLPRALALCDQEATHIRKWITHVFPIEEIQAAFELTEAYRNGVIKAVIQIYPEHHQKRSSMQKG